MRPYSNAVRKNIFISFSFAAVIFTCKVNAQAVYETRQAGNWSNASTWKDNVVPPTTIPVNQKVIIRHWTRYNNSNQLYVYGTIEISGDTLRWLESGSGNNVNIYPGGL